MTQALGLVLWEVMTRILAAAVALALLVPAPLANGSGPASSPTVTQPVASRRALPSRLLGQTFLQPGQFSATRAFAHVRHLAGTIGPRPAGSSAYRRAARYVHEKFVQLGYRARLVPFQLPNGATSRNVVATWPSPARSRILIGAHLDTVSGSPGANDNASGVAVVLELARVYAGTREARDIRFVAFGAEEVQPGGGHHFGSTAYVEIARPRAMVSVDMIGLDRTIIVGWMGIGSRKTVAALLMAAKRAGVRAREKVLPDWSDNGPFERAGVPSALLWTGDEPNHHQPTDVVANVKKVALTATGSLLVSYVSDQLAS